MKKFDILDTEENIKSLLDKNSLNRNINIKQFINLIDSLDFNYIVNLNGEWGSGKTIFIKQVKYIIDNIEKDKAIKLNNTYKTFYYNAWENDFHNDPLLSILFNLAKEMNVPMNNNFKSIYSNIIKFTTSIIPGISKIDPDDYEIVSKFDDIINAEDIHEKMKDALDEIIQGNCDKLIIFVDDLDRANPTYVLRLLERVKHFFSDDRLIFIFATDRSELSHVVKKHYGSDFNGNKYLEKFFDFEYEMPNYDKKEYFLNKFNKTQSDRLDDMCINVTKMFNFSIRQMNRYITYIDKFSEFKQKYANENDKVYLIYLILLPLLYGVKIYDPIFYNQILINNNVYRNNLKEMVNEKHYITKFDYTTNVSKEILNVKSFRPHSNNTLDTVILDKLLDECYSNENLKKQLLEDFNIIVKV